MQDYRKLKVWERAHALVLEIYQATRPFLKEEIYGLTSQIRRSAYSVPSNIAEGCGRGTDPDFARFLTIAMGSGSELDYQLLLSRDLGLLDSQRYSELASKLDEVRRMLSGLHQTVKAF